MDISTGRQVLATLWAVMRPAQLRDLWLVGRPQLPMPCLPRPMNAIMRTIDRGQTMTQSKGSTARTWLGASRRVKPSPATATPSSSFQ
jgi:hypothetical protein